MMAVRLLVALALLDLLIILSGGLHNVLGGLFPVLR